jgi:hypothetical protein
MTEYAGVIEVWFKADNQEYADEKMKELQTAVIRNRPWVTMVESSRAEKVMNAKGLSTEEECPQVDEG